MKKWRGAKRVRGPERIPHLRTSTRGATIVAEPAGYLIARRIVGIIEGGYD